MLITNTSEKEVLIAFIASGTSLFVALISLVAAIMSQRFSLKANKSIETLKFNFTRTMSNQAIADKHFCETLDALKLSIQTIQRLKDELQLILSAIGSSLDSKTAIERIIQSREKLFVCYEQSLPSLDEQDAKILHQAKKQTIVIESFLRDALGDREYVSSLSEEERQQLLLLRSNLNDIQQNLRDSKTDTLIKRTING